MFEEAEWKIFIQKLLHITASGVVHWHMDGEEYYLQVGKVYYSLGSVDGDGRPPYFLRLFDLSTPEDIDRLESKPRPEADIWGDDNRNLTAAQMVPGLYAAARRDALGGPAKFKELVNELDMLDLLEPGDFAP